MFWDSWRLSFQKQVWQFLKQKACWFLLFCNFVVNGIYKLKDTSTGHSCLIPDYGVCSLYSGYTMMHPCSPCHDHFCWHICCLQGIMRMNSRRFYAISKNGARNTTRWNYNYFSTTSSQFSHHAINKKWFAVPACPDRRKLWPFSMVTSTCFCSAVKLKKRSFTCNN